MSEVPLTVVAGAISLSLSVVFVVVILSVLKRCPPDQAMLISGLMSGTEHGPFKIVSAGAAVVLPVIQQVNFINLDVRKIRIKTAAPLISVDGLSLNVELAAQIKVKRDDISIARAAQWMVGKSSDEIGEVVSAQVLSKLPSVVTKVPAEQFKQNFDLYADFLSEDFEKKLGIECVSMSLVNVT